MISKTSSEYAKKVLQKLITPAILQSRTVQGGYHQDELHEIQESISQIENGKSKRKFFTKQEIQ